MQRALRKSIPMAWKAHGFVRSFGRAKNSWSVKRWSKLASRFLDAADSCTELQGLLTTEILELPCLASLVFIAVHLARYRTQDCREMEETRRNILLLWSLASSTCPHEGNRNEKRITGANTAEEWANQTATGWLKVVKRWRSPHEMIEMCHRYQWHKFFCTWMVTDGGSFVIAESFPESLRNTILVVLRHESWVLLHTNCAAAGKT